MDNNTFIHSGNRHVYFLNLTILTLIDTVLVGNSTTMKNVVQRGKLNSDGLSGRHDVNDQELLDEALAEYGLRSVTNLTKAMLKSATKNPEVAKAFDCQMENYECMLRGRESVDEVKKCAQLLCSCLANAFK